MVKKRKNLSKNQLKKIVEGIEGAETRMNFSTSHDFNFEQFIEGHSSQPIGETIDILEEPNANMSTDNYVNMQAALQSFKTENLKLDLSKLDLKTTAKLFDESANDFKTKMDNYTEQNKSYTQKRENLQKTGLFKLLDFFGAGKWYQERSIGQPPKAPSADERKNINLSKAITQDVAKSANQIFAKARDEMDNFKFTRETYEQLLSCRDNLNSLKLQHKREQFMDDVKTNNDRASELLSRGNNDLPELKEAIENLDFMNLLVEETKNKLKNKYKFAVILKDFAEHFVDRSDWNKPILRIKGDGFTMMEPNEDETKGIDIANAIKLGEFISYHIANQVPMSDISFAPEFFDNLAAWQADDLKSQWDGFKNKIERKVVQMNYGSIMSDYVQMNIKEFPLQLKNINQKKRKF